jgi:hypothetical protein
VTAVFVHPAVVITPWYTLQQGCEPKKDGASSSASLTNCCNDKNLTLTGSLVLNSCNVVNLTITGKTAINSSTVVNLTVVGPIALNRLQYSKSDYAGGYKDTGGSYTHLLLCLVIFLVIRNKLCFLFEPSAKLCPAEGSTARRPNI